MLLFFSKISLICFINFFGTSSSSKDNYEKILADILLNEGLNTFDIVAKYGYPLEVHQLVSEDGYLIDVHRIPYGRNDKNTERPAVLIAPGISITSTHFLNTGNNSLGFILSESGYDVWIYNARGTAYSRRHTRLNPDYKDYWMFSWHEIAIYDYPICIDYIRSVTKQNKIFYIGYSQGVTSFGVLMSEKPEYNEKIRLSVLLATSVYTTHNKNNVILYLAKNYSALKRIFDVMGLYELSTHYYGARFCRMFLFLCEYMFYLLFGYGPEQIEELIPLIASTPGGTSMMALEHYAQIFINRKYQKMDYGTSENLIRYGTEDPPLYNTSKITTPVALFCGNYDLYATCDDMLDLAEDLPNVALKYIVPYEMWTHMDFLFGKDAPELVYKVLIELMSKYK